MIINILIMVIGVIAGFSIGYFVYAANYAGIGSSFLGFWMAFSILCFLVIGVLILHKKNNILSVIPKAIRVAIIAITVIGLVGFFVMEWLIFTGMTSQASEDVDYVVVLGAQVKGTRVTKSLAKRLDAAISYYENNDDVKIVCTGGKGSGEDVTEAYAMKQYLVERGVDENKVILEDKSKNTYQNLKFAKEIIGDDDAKIAVVTNNFHVYRAMHLAEYVGFKKVQGIAAESDNRLLLNYMVREGFALAKELVLR